MPRQLIINGRNLFPISPDVIPAPRIQDFFILALAMASARLEVNIGSREYIDEILLEDLKAPVTFGKDQHGRHFFAIVCEVLVDGQWEKTSFVVFNRYLDNPWNWQGAHSENSLISARSCFPPAEVKLFTEILSGAKDRKLTKADCPSKKAWIDCPVRLWEM